MMRLSLRPSRFALDVVALLSSRILAQGLSIAVGLMLVRLLADSVFGAYSLATTTIGLAGVIADFGLDVVLTRDVAAQRHAASALTRSAIGLRIMLALLVVGVLGIAGTLTPAIGRPDLLLIGGLSLVPRGVMRAIAAALTGLGYIRESALIEGIGAVGGSVSTVILVLGGFAMLGDQAAAAMWGMMVGSVFGLVSALHLGRNILPASGSRSNSWSGLLAAAAPFLVVGLAGAAFQSLDIYVVKVFYWQAGQPDAVALYAAPFRILNALLLAPTAWGVVALPRYVRYVRRPRLLRLALHRDFRLGLLMGLGLSAACTLFAYPLTAIALGQNYVISAPVLAVLGWMALPVCLSAPLIAVLTASGHQRRIAVSVLGAGVIAVAANILLGATAGGRGLIDNLMIVAMVKVASMAVLLAFYWKALSGRAADTLRGRTAKTGDD